MNITFKRSLVAILCAVSTIGAVSPVFARGVAAATGRSFGTGVWSSWTTDTLMNIQWNGGGNAGWITSLPNPVTGPAVSMTVRAYATGSGTAPTCRVYHRAGNGSIIAASSDVTVPVSGAATTLGTFSVAATDNLLTYCTMASGGGKLAGFSY